MTKIEDLANQYLVEQEGAFYEVRRDPEVRKNQIQDWLVAFGVTGSSPHASYNRFYQTMEQIVTLLRI